MTATPVTEFFLVHLQEDAAVEEGGAPANLALPDVIPSLKQAEGSNRVFFGRQLEYPSIGVVVILWSSLAASSAFAASPAFSALQATLAAISANPTSSSTPHRTLLSPADGAAAALAAPTTEVFTGYGVQPGFEANVRAFAGRVDAERPAGYRGCAVGPVAEEVCKGAGGGEEKGPAVKLLVGWDSKEAHVEAKGKPGAIQENIHLLRALRKEVDMWHVNLQEL